jgi:serine/threonine protein kinase
MPLELTPTRPTVVHAVYDKRAEDATRPDIVPAYSRFSDDATRPDIIPARHDFEEESGALEFVPDRYLKTEYLAHEDWPDVRLAHRESRSGERSAVVLHHPSRRIAQAGTLAHERARASLFERRLLHPLVIPALDLASLDDELVVVSEYVAGITLAGLLREGGPLRPSLAIAIACDVLRALSAGHGATSASGEALGCVHGTLTPSDVLVCADGRSRLIDFSVAESASASRSARTNGHGGYVSPERVFDRHIDPRTDVFLVGVLLWESLTGYGLLAGDNPFARLMKLVREGFDPPSRFNADVPDWLDDAVARALDPAPEQRHRSAAEFANALAATLRPASAADVAEYVGLVGGPYLERQQVSRRAASEPPPASRTRRTRATSSARAKVDPRTVPTVRPPSSIRRAPNPAAARVKPDTKPAVRMEGRLELVATERITERPARDTRVVEPTPLRQTATTSTQRPSRGLRIATLLAASAAVALLAAVTGSELARALHRVESPAPVMAVQSPPPTPKAASAPIATAAANAAPEPAAEASSVPVVTVDELPVAKASKRKKPPRRWRAPARR